jgi:taurine dioxygenase
MASESEYTHIRVAPMSGALGAEISGVDLTKPLDRERTAEIRRAWLEHQVVCFRDQGITPAQQVAFAEYFGVLDTYPFIEPLPEQPAVIPIVKEKETRANFGGGWHSDTTYQACPPMATLLYARDVPARGGDTLFANMYSAYEALSDGMKSLLSGLAGVFTASKVHGSTGYYQKADHPMASKKDPNRVEERHFHPLVRTHPETQRKGLFVSLPHITRIDGMKTEESTPLLEYLARHATRPEFTTRLTWREGSLTMWDNRCVQHYALNDYAGERREMHRITLKGDAPF